MPWRKKVVLGFIHKNMTIEEQAKNVRKVKTYEAGIVSDPVTVTAELTIADALILSEDKGFLRFSSNRCRTIL